MIRIIFLFLMMSSMVLAMPQYMNMLSGKVPSGSLVHRCVTCHSSKGSLALNLFGRDFHAVFIAPNPLKIPGIQVMTPAQKWDYLLNKLDSNKNGLSNYQDIVQRQNPGLTQ
jgi:hypothetical protein